MLYLKTVTEEASHEEESAFDLIIRSVPSPKQTATTTMMEEQQPATRLTKNPHALDCAQDPNECFEVMEAPPADFNPSIDTPKSKKVFTTRGDAHENGLWHCSVHIWIVDTASTSILLQKRSMKKDTFPGRVSTYFVE